MLPAVGSCAARRARQPGDAPPALALGGRAGRRDIGPLPVSPSALQLEITESLLLIDFEQAEERLSHFRALGIRIALDDFGAGYSSLSYIRRLPLDVIKIDRSFARDISSDGQAEAVVKAIVQLAQALDLHIIAEGIETESQALRLTSCGCFVQQGYLFGRPMPLSEITQRLGAGANPMHVTRRPASRA